MDDAGQAAAPAAPAVPQTPRQRGFNTKDLFISEYNPGTETSGTADEWVFSVLAMIESHEAQVGGKWPPLPLFMFLASKFRGEAVQWFREYSRSLQAHERTPENLLEAVALRFGSPMTDEDAVLSVTNTKKLPTENYQDFAKKLVKAAEGKPVSQSLLITTFMKRIDEIGRLGVKGGKPKNLTEAVHFANEANDSKGVTEAATPRRKAADRGEKPAAKSADGKPKVLLVREGDEEELPSEGEGEPGRLKQWPQRQGAGQGKGKFQEKGKRHRPEEGEDEPPRWQKRVRRGPQPDDTCKWCFAKGHWAMSCPTRIADMQQRRGQAQQQAAEVLKRPGTSN